MKTAQEMVETNAGIWEHYIHACEKHPEFADDICVNTGLWKEFAEEAKGLTCGTSAHMVLSAELYEIFAAYCDGDIAQARYEVLDAIAVLLRMDDMLANHK